MSENIFEGIVSVKMHADAIEAKGECFWCSGKVEVLLHIDDDQKALIAEHDIGEAQMRQRLYDLIQQRHECGARLHDGKTSTKDFLKRFE